LRVSRSVIVFRGAYPARNREAKDSELPKTQAAEAAIERGPVAILREGIGEVFNGIVDLLHSLFGPRRVSPGKVMVNL
jgi:hypothetical protein